MDNCRIMLEAPPAELGNSDKDSSNQLMVSVNTDNFHLLSNAPKKHVDFDTASETSEATGELSLISSSASSSDQDLTASGRKVQWWDRKKMYSDLIVDGLQAKNNMTDAIMLFESPSSATSESSFYNSGIYKMHDWPPPKSTRRKEILGPCRYAGMNGCANPVYLREETPMGLLEHWADSIPGFVAPTFVNSITDDDLVYAYLPAEQIKNHVNDPNVHFHLVGKDAIHLMTQKTTKLLPNTQDVRPCIAKTTHSMGSKGIFVIKNDDDEAEFQQFLADSGSPTYVITEFVEIARNVACHFFIHPNGEVTWLGSNENYRKADGSWSSDSYLVMEDQETLRDMQLPFVEDVVQYCLSLGFWGFCGVDVLFNPEGQGYLVDVNPRVTGSCPALMTLQLLQDAYGFKVGLFRRSGDVTFFGTSEELLAEVSEFNSNSESSRVVLHSFFESDPGICKINIGVYGNDLESCTATLNHFAKRIII